ncbi:MAG: HAMP domain-containing sensor histidine kinase, partial [Halobacteria archaeon]|nr:HAMP domain-containing sensor histidine kinase [Halobacteria archaeon]
LGNVERAGRVILVHDITDQKERQDELERQNERLDEFASIVSHDLRNPLNVAQGYVDMARESPDEETIDEIDESLDRMENIIDDVLTLARQGQTLDEKEEVELGEVVEEAWSNVDTGNATLEIETGGVIKADRGRLLQMFENLFRNSIEHGGNDVTVRVGEIPDGFYVEDTGKGIPSQERHAVLEQGYTTSDSGTGFGLSIVESIADAHHWEISVGESDEDGARFEFSEVEVLQRQGQRQKHKKARN